MVFQYVALSGYTQLRRIDADAMRNKAVAPPLLEIRVVGVFVEDRAVKVALRDAGTIPTSADDYAIAREALPGLEPEVIDGI